MRRVGYGLTAPAAGFVFAAALAWGQAAPAPAQTAPAAAPAPAGNPIGGFNLNDASLTEVIDIMARELKINYVIDAAVKGGSVTVHTYGTVRDVDLRPLFETILRMNNLALVQVGGIFRIVPVNNLARQPIQPISQPDSAKLPEDERIVLNLIFLRYALAGEMSKVLTPFLGDGGQMSSYDPANLLILLDNSRNMRRTLDLIAMFDSDSFAGQRVRPYEVKNGRASDIAKDLEDVFKAYSLTGSKDRGAIQFMPVDRVNTILAVAPNPGVFAEVDKWIAKFDVVPKANAGGVQNHVYKLKYGRAEILGGVVMQLYGGCGNMGSGYSTGFGGANGMPGNTGFPGAATGGYAGGAGGGYSSGFGGNAGAYGSAYGGAQSYGQSGGAYGTTGASPFGGGYGSGNCGPYGGGMSGYGGYGGTGTAAAAPVTLPGAAPAGGAQKTDKTGSYLGAESSAGLPPGAMMPRIVPNPFDNTLVVQCSGDLWEQIRNLMDELDVSPRQVLIDARIYEVDLSGSFEAGVEAFLQNKGTANSTVPGRQLIGSSTGQLLLSAGTLVGQSRELLALLQAQETKTKAKVLSAPSVIATDSIPASITVGDSVPTLTSQAVNAGVTSGGNSLFTQTISNTSTGIGLNILARVNASGIVTLVINQAVTAPEPNPLGSGINSPSFSQRNVSTQVTVQDGDTVAIGGIINESTTETWGGIPGLDKLPYIGAVFGSHSTSKKRTELIVFLTPRVIYDTNQVTDATQELKDRFKGLRKMIPAQ